MNSAIISDCGTYRYVLNRDIPCALRWVKPCLFCMLNPSVADDVQDDPTIRRCIGFATSWSCSSLTVVNLFALRATDPAALARHPDPIGPQNDHHLRKQFEEHQLGHIILAWGAHPIAESRARSLGALLEGRECIRITKDGWPSHPLYLPKGHARQFWKMPPERKPLPPGVCKKCGGTGEVGWPGAWPCPTCDPNGRVTPSYMG